MEVFKWWCYQDLNQKKDKKEWGGVCVLMWFIGGWTSGREEGGGGEEVVYSKPFSVTIGWLLTRSHMLLPSDCPPLIIPLSSYQTLNSSS